MPQDPLERVSRDITSAMLSLADLVSDPAGYDSLAVIEMKSAIDYLSLAARRMEMADLLQTRAIAANPIAAANAWYPRNR